jgi:hypothetical protein
MYSMGPCRVFKHLAFLKMRILPKRPENQAPLLMFKHSTTVKTLDHLLFTWKPRHVYRSITVAAAPELSIAC